MLSNDAERDARATYVVAVSPFEDSDESLLAGRADVQDGESVPDIGETQYGALRIFHSQQPEVWFHIFFERSITLDKRSEERRVKCDSIYHT